MVNTGLSTLFMSDYLCLSICGCGCVEEMCSGLRVKEEVVVAGGRRCCFWGSVLGLVCPADE